MKNIYFYIFTFSSNIELYKAHFCSTFGWDVFTCFRSIVSRLNQKLFTPK